MLLLITLALIVALYFGYDHFRRSSTPKVLKPKNAELMKVLLNLDEEPLDELIVPAFRMPPPLPRIYKVSYGNALGTSTLGGNHQFPVPIIRLNEFLDSTLVI